MPKFVSKAQPPLAFIPQRLTPWVIETVRFLLPVWMPWKLSVTSVEAENLEVLVKLYQEFQAGNTRFLMAFRHPSTKDPFAMSYMLWRLVPKEARKSGIRFKRPTYSHFMYDRGIPLWAGEFVSWLFPRLGGTPILRGKADRVGLRAARDIFANSPYPIAIAPEGGTNEHNELVSPLEPGVAQMGFWCIEDLLKANRSESVYIVPLRIRYRYVSPPWKAIKDLLGQLEAQMELTAEVTPSGLLEDPEKDALYGRVLRLGECLLAEMDRFYSKYYHLPRPVVDPLPYDPPDRNAKLAFQLKQQLDIALQAAESYFGITAKGEIVDRCRRLEQASFDRIYRQDLEQLTPLEHGMADWLAQEASLRIGHMRMVERLTMVSGNYILEKPTGDRFAEIVLIMWKIMTFMQGGDSHSPPQLGAQSLKLTISDPISVTDLWPTYSANRKGAKKAVDELTQSIQTALEDLNAIEP
ncbi:1-acyl-sn-glycerol-3-phosphate acyltransferase [Acaryochloris marina]|uniref:Acyltransferase family protein n=1 Tax=Acaryochloris marina (strain MBIC 11017) TaxID=329726 RepID=B0CEI2_ACAM1|nr:1-acyl-sn-glycerol-3-phosphate acyltransferase [Acaryochloris marina]ABW26948.1 acyltransferase family protein [Acaryochloris marina MBIC11017]BDM81715.1 glycerol acyltransferase [Acaryochloris marina MBIC10699]